MALKFTNNAYTTLTSTIAASATSFDIASAASFPTLGVGDWTYVSLTDEVVKVTAISGLTCTCDAVVGGHSSGIAVELRMTAELLEDVKPAANSIGATELDVTGNGTSGQYLGSDADGTFTWTTISADPAVGGDLSGTASNAQIVANAVTDAEIASNAVTTAKINDNAVTGAKIAMGSDAAGDILYYNGTDYIRLAKGTAGQALIMNAGVTAPEWGVGVDYSETIVTPTAAQTSFTHSYTVGRVQVFLNGVKLLLGASNDFTASNGTTVVLATGATTSDRVEFVNF